MKKRRNLPAKRYVIIGAGAAGLSLCHALLERGVTDEIVILDQKPAFSDDRTWCFWNTAPHPYSALASHCWHRWDVLDAASRLVSQSSAGTGYACLRGSDFYASVCEIIRRFPSVTLKLNSPMTDCRSEAGGAVVTAGAEIWDADYVFDSRPRPIPPGGLTFSQRFMGQFVRTDAPTFDPSRCDAHGLSRFLSSAACTLFMSCRSRRRKRLSKTLIFSAKTRRD